MDFFAGKFWQSPGGYRSYNSTYRDEKPNRNDDILDHTYGLELHLSGQIIGLFHQNLPDLNHQFLEEIVRRVEKVATWKFGSNKT